MTSPTGSSTPRTDFDILASLVNRDIEGAFEEETGYTLDAALAAQASSEAPRGTICKCGGAKDYHRPADRRDHEYEPRYPASSEAEGLDELRLSLRAAVTALPTPTLGLMGGVSRGQVIDAIDAEFSRLAESRPDWYDTNARLAKAAARLRGESRHDK